MQLTQANRMTLGQMFTGLGGSGKFLLVRTRHPPNDTGTEMLGTLVSVIDPEGSRTKSGRETACFIRLMNYSSSVNHEALPTGTYLALKNPDPKKLLVWDNPSDVQPLSHKEVKAIMGEGFTWPWHDDDSGQGSPQHPFWRTLEAASDSVIFERLRRLGNQLFITQRWSDAIRFYDLALQYAHTEKDRSMTLSNKAATLIRLGCFNAANKVARLALDVDSSNKKALYRLGQALVRLGKYEDAAGEMEGRVGTFVDQDEKNDSLHELLNEAKERKHGPPTPQDYIAVVAINNGVRQIGTRFVHVKIPTAEIRMVTDKLTEFVGPLEVRKSKSSGGTSYGLFATEDIVPGQVILVSRPICQHSCKEVTGGGGCTTDLKCRIANMVHFDPTFGPLIHQLSVDDGEKKSDVPSNSSVDVERLERMLIRVGASSFGEGWCALWSLPSFINQSCSERNVVREVYGNGEVMVVKALEKVEKGRELLAQYVGPTLPYEEKQDVLKTAFGFSCSCNLCSWQLQERHTEVGRRFRRLASLLTAGITYKGLDASHSPFAKREIEDLVSDLDFLVGLWNELKLPGLAETYRLQNSIMYIRRLGEKEGKFDLINKALQVNKFAVSQAPHGAEKTMTMMSLHYILELLREETMLANLRSLKEEILLWYGDLEGWRRHIAPGEGFVQHLKEMGIDLFSL